MSIHIGKLFQKMLLLFNNNCNGTIVKLRFRFVHTPGEQGMVMVGAPSFTCDLLGNSWKFILEPKGYSLLEIICKNPHIHVLYLEICSPILRFVPHCLFIPEYVGYGLDVYIYSFCKQDLDDKEEIIVLVYMSMFLSIPPTLHLGNNVIIKRY